MKRLVIAGTLVRSMVFAVLRSARVVDGEPLGARHGIIGSPGVLLRARTSLKTSLSSQKTWELSGKST